MQTTNPDGTVASQLYRPFEQVMLDEEDTHTASRTSTANHDFVFDGLGRQVETLERNGTAVYTTRFGYDLLDNLIIITDTQGNVKHQTFDGLKRKLTMDDPDRGHMTYTYDDAGQHAGDRSTRRANAFASLTMAPTVSSARTTSRRLAIRRRTCAITTMTIWPPEYADAHNTVGRLAWVEDPSGREYLSYDDRGNVAGRIKRITSTGTGGSLDFVTLLRYDAMDRPIELTYPDGITVSYHYNQQSLLDAIPGYVNNIGYLASDQRADLATADCVQTAYAYDQRLRLTQLQSINGAGVTLQDLRYQFDGVSNIVAIADARPTRTSTDDDSRNFKLDASYRLTQVRYLTGTLDQINYRYNPLGNMISQTSTVPAANLGILQYGQSAGPHALTQVGSVRLALRSQWQSGKQAWLYIRVGFPRPPDRGKRFYRPASG